MKRHHPLRDHFFRRAKAEGHAARSVYKLQEMDQRWRLIRAGHRVLDLGAAPGSWLQYAARIVGPTGHVLGYDLKPIDVPLPAWAEARVADAFEARVAGNFDVVLSDMAPATMGHHGTDALRSAALAERALQLAEQHLRPAGHVVLKVLEGGEVPGLCARLRLRFAKLERLRPRATRAHSTEIFLLGISLKSA